MATVKTRIKRRRPGRIFRQREIDEAMGEIIRGQTVRFLVDKRYFEKLQFDAPDDKDTFENILILLSAALRGLIQLNSVYEQMIVSYRMAQRYPWDHRLIKRSEHLHFVWMVFVNLCYLLEERFKLAAKAHNAAVVAFKSGDSLKVREGVERIAKGLRDHIQARGEFTHQWRSSHDVISNYQMVELAYSTGGMPKGFKLKQSYGLSRMLIVMEMQRALPIVEEILLELIEGHKKSLLPISARVTEVLKRLEAKKGNNGSK